MSAQMYEINKYPTTNTWLCLAKPVSNRWSIVKGMCVEHERINAANLMRMKIYMMLITKFYLYFFSGRYCIYKAQGHSCPAGFTDGYIYWDDAAPHVGHSLQKTSGRYM